MRTNKKKSRKSIYTNIFTHIHFKIKQKRGIPFLPIFTFPEVLKISVKNWFTASMGYDDVLL
jgi:hypothetical protein